MPLEKPRITARIAGLALHPLLAPIAVGCFFAAFACDLVYVQATLFAPKGIPELAATTERLLGAGLVMAGLTVLVALIDLVGERRFRSLPDLRMYAAGSALVVALEMYNLDLRQTGGLAAITPMGLILSLCAVAILLATPSQNWARMYR